MCLSKSRTRRWDFRKYARLTKQTYIYYFVCDDIFEITYVVAVCVCVFVCVFEVVYVVKQKKNKSITNFLESECRERKEH